MEGTNSHQESPVQTQAQREALVQGAEDLIDRVALRLRDEGFRSLPMDELRAYGLQGLLEAASRFDPRQGNDFRRFAYFRVRGSMLDGMRKMGSWSRRGYERITLLLNANQASADEDEQLAEEEPDAQAAAEKLRKHMASMVTAMSVGIFCDHVHQKEEAYVAVDTTANAEELLGDLQLNDLVKKTIAELPPPEDEVVRRFYVEGEKMDLIAADMGHSRSWVSRMHTRALSRMGARLRAHCLSQESAL